MSGEPTKAYRLRDTSPPLKHYTAGRRVQPGEVVQLSDRGYAALKDKFEPVDKPSAPRAEVSAAQGPPSSPPPADSPVAYSVSLLNGNVSKVLRALAGVGDRGHLAFLHATESAGKVRKVVLREIERKLAALDATEEESR